MINVSELINDPDFAQTFTVTRTTGAWVEGNFTQAIPTTLNIIGIIQPMNTNDMVQLPEGDAIKGAINIYSLTPINTTSQTPSAVSDQVTWKGEQYKIIQTQNYSDWGYYKASAVRILGA